MLFKLRGYFYRSALAEEKKFLTQFMDSAKKGLITTVTKVKRAYEAKIEQIVDRSTIYRLLERHGWRKVMPRSHHPDTNFEEQEEFKQQFPNWAIALREDSIERRDPSESELR
jgi:transposase